MSLSLYQIVIPFWALIMLMYAISKYRRKKKTVRELIIWILFWGTLSFFAIFPEKTAIFSSITGFEDNANAIFFISLVLLFVVVFKLVIIIENLEYKLNQLISQEALKTIDPKSKE